MCDSDVGQVKDIFLFHKTEDIIVYADNQGQITINRRCFDVYREELSNYKNFRQFYEANSL